VMRRESCLSEHESDQRWCQANYCSMFSTLITIESYP
jgi:hypothetical protein